MDPRIRISLHALPVVLAIAGAPGVFAQAPPAPIQSEENHGTHHPATNAQAVPVTPPATGSSTAQSGQMPTGMMTGDGNQMMSMMRNMMTMMGAMMSRDVDSRIAAVKTELKITEAQEPQWNRFADALRTTGKSMNGMFEQMMQPGTTVTLPARLDRQEKMLEAHLNALTTLKGALDPLYATLNDDQKKVADALMIGPMGMM